MIDAEFRSEERFSRLSLAYSGDVEKKLVSLNVENIIAKYNIQPDLHISSIKDNKEVLVIEYHDDIDREAGAIFEEILKELNITQCN